MSTLSLSRRVLETWCANRKMVFSDVTKNLVVTDDSVLVATFEQVQSLANELAVPVADLLRTDYEPDLDHGVKISHGHEGFLRVSERNGTPYYVYQHLATTSALPNLMALRVSVLCNDEDKIVLNGGHSSYEFVYVTHGTLRMHWETNDGRYSAELGEGDSVYIHPGVSHSFIALQDKAELIAVNF